MHTIETGDGQTTVAFALAGAQHITITPDQGQIERIRDYLRKSGVENNVSFVQASSDTVLPAGEGIPPRLDFVFIDGAHRFPFPIIDWYYTANRVPIGGVVAVDDCRMPSVRILHDFLAGEDDWELVQLIHVTAFFRRVRDTVNQWDWADQRINKPHLDMIARKSAPDPKDDPVTRFLRKLI
jgi:predicted O-methyltransferase YrrM